MYSHDNGSRLNEQHHESEGINGFVNPSISEGMNGSAKRQKG
jgi:hypothetical protein